jgi:hypothetical protein
MTHIGLMVLIGGDSSCLNKLETLQSASDDDNLNGNVNASAEDGDVPVSTCKNGQL